jgi:hypothetical protein
MDIMMAQDFQDLTGQVISRITGIAQNLEKQLVQVLVDFAPERNQARARQRPAERSADQAGRQERRRGRPGPGRRPARQPRFLKRRGTQTRPSSVVSSGTS